jgi:hypothetical protein
MFEGHGGERCGGKSRTRALPIAGRGFRGNAW